MPPASKSASKSKTAPTKPADRAIPPAPMPREEPKRLEKFGDVRVDPWFWLRDRESKRVLEHLKAENAYLDAVMKPTERLQAQVFEEMKSRIKQDDSSYPAPHGPYSYWARFEKGKEYAIYCRKRNEPGAREEVILDSNELAKGSSFFELGHAKVSPDHRILAYAIDTVGRRFFTLRFKDLATGKTLDDVIPDMTGNVAWANDNRTVFYTRQHPETLRWDRVLRHELGTPAAQDSVVFEEKDETFNVSVSRGDADRHLFIQSESTLSSEIRYLDADWPRGEWKVFLPREKDHEYDVVDGGDRFFVHTNWKARNFRLMEAPLEDTRKKAWKELVRHRPATLLERVSAFKTHLVLEERSNGLTQIQILPRKDAGAAAKGIRARYLKFTDPAYLAGVGDNREYDTPWLRFEYESMTTPDSVYDFDVRAGKQVLRKQREVLGGFDPKNYVSERLFARAKDGKRVPISIVRRKSTRKAAATPLLVYGYGSYGHSMDPYFNSAVLSLLDRGFAYAIAHVRGGSEMGRAWYEDGRQDHKMNTFTDFIAATEFLQKQGFSSPAHTYAMGGSAGGLLVGAVINLRPDLYNGVVAQVPFVDVLTTMLDASIPLTTGEYDEWGNPNTQKYYRYIKRYSPYDNVRAQAYPHVLVTTGLHDSQVQYWEPAKWVLKLRKLKTDPYPVLFKIEMDAGHGGKAGRFEALKMWALEYSFLLWLEGQAGSG